MSWNHRVIAYDNIEEIYSKTSIPAPDTPEIYFEIVEMYYDANNIPNGYSENTTVGGDTIKGMRWSLNKMKEALKKPIISVKNFPAEYKEKKDY